MPEKLHPAELKGVSETLLIPLHYRVEESRNASSAFRDAMGERFRDLIAYDWNKSHPAKVVARGRFEGRKDCPRSFPAVNLSAISSRRQ